MDSSNYYYDDDDDGFRTDAAPPVPYPEIIVKPKTLIIYPKKQIVKESTCTICGKKVRCDNHNFNHI